MNSRIPPELINYENQMDDYFDRRRKEEEIERLGAEMLNVIAVGEGITPEEAKAVFRREIEKQIKEHREKRKRQLYLAGSVVAAVVVFGYFLWFWWEAMK